MQEKTLRVDIKDIILLKAKQTIYLLEEPECIGVVAGKNPIIHRSDVFKHGEKIGKRPSIIKHNLASNHASNLLTSPIDEIIHWHKAIKMELAEITEEARRMHHSGEISNMPAFIDRLQFFADVCIFHRYSACSSI